jgi:predicted metal-binding protein
MSLSFSLLVVGKVRLIAAFVCGEDIASRVCTRVNVLQTRVCVFACYLSVCMPA